MLATPLSSTRLVAGFAAQCLFVLDVSNVFAGHPAATCNLAAGLTPIAIVDLSGNSSTAAPLHVKDAVGASVTVSYCQAPWDWFCEILGVRWQHFWLSVITTWLAQCEVCSKSTSQLLSVSVLWIHGAEFTELIPCFLALLLSRFSKRGRTCSWSANSGCHGAASVLLCWQLSFSFCFVSFKNGPLNLYT